MPTYEFKKGDRVTGNHRNPTFEGRTGTVTYVSGNQYWVKFDDGDTIEPGLYSWWLEPVAEGVRTKARAA